MHQAVSLSLFIFNILLLKRFKQNYKKSIQFAFFLQLSMFFEVYNYHIDISVI